MKRLFEAPSMNISIFEAENIVTLSGPRTAEEVAQKNLIERAATNNIELTGDILKFNITTE